MNGQRVNFQSDHQPRARYLYWQSCVSLLRAAWLSEHRRYNPVMERIWKQFWGSRGSWIRRKYILGFAEYIGHVLEWMRLSVVLMNIWWRNKAMAYWCLRANNPIPLVSRRIRLQKSQSTRTIGLLWNLVVNNQGKLIKINLKDSNLSIHFFEFRNPFSPPNISIINHIDWF